MPPSAPVRSLPGVPCALKHIHQAALVPCCELLLLVKCAASVLGPNGIGMWHDMKPMTPSGRSAEKLDDDDAAVMKAVIAQMSPPHRSEVFRLMKVVSHLPVSQWTIVDREVRGRSRPRSDFPLSPCHDAVVLRLRLSETASDRVLYSLC